MTVVEISKALLISLIVTIIFLYSLILNLNKPVELSHGDTFHVTLTLKHYMDVVLGGSWADILTVPMFYGFEKSLLFSELFIFQGIMALPVFVVTGDIILTYNLISLITIFLSVLSMFIFLRFMTGNFWPAVLGSVIYVFNPFVIGHFPDNLHYFSLQWIPLIFLFLEKSLREPNKKNTFLFFIFLTLQFLTTLTFAALLTVILPLYVVTRYIQLKPNLKKYVNFGSIFGLVIFVSTAFGIQSLYNSYFGDSGLQRDLNETAVFSPWISDLFFTSPNNLIYGNLRNWAGQTFGNFVFANPEYVERNLFPGIAVFILFISSFFLVKNSPFRKVWLLAVGLYILAVLLSFGPRMRLSYDFSFPGLYGLVHAFHPLLQELRVASRFMVLAFFFMGIIAALAAAQILKKPKGVMIIITFIIFIILEYSSFPWKFHPIPKEVINLYSTLGKQKDVQVLLELPMGNLFSRIGLAHNQFVDTQYMLYASALHDKKLFNGYSSYTPVEYPARVEYLAVNFPNPVKLKKLQSWGVDAIALHKKEFFTQTEYERIARQLEEFGVDKIYQTPDLALFNLKNWQDSL